MISEKNLALISEGSQCGEIEESPGVWAHRRKVLSFLPAGVTLAALASASKTFAADEAIDFERFLEAANAKADELIMDASAAGQDRYLRALSSLAAGLPDSPAPAAWNDSGQSDGPGTYIGFVPGGRSFTVLQWRMEPGARILPHAHTYGNVVTVGLEGAALVSNYEVIGKPDFETDAPFRARKTVQQALRPGDVNLVSLKRNYIHGFEAGADGARGLDITTRLKPKPDYSTPFLHPRGATSPDAVGAEFEAIWQRR